MSVPEKKKNKLLPIIFGLLIIVGAAFGIKQYIYYSRHVDTDDAQIDGDISPVIARVGGYVKTINFEEHSKVKAGQVLVTLDDRDYGIKLEQAEAAEAGANAGVGVSRAQIAAMAANTQTALSNIEAAKVKVNFAEKDLQRYQNLIKDGGVTQQALDQAKAQQETAQAAYTAAVAQYKAILKQVGTTESQLGVSGSNLASYESDVHFAKLQLSYTIIRAPVSGVVTKKNIQTGQLLQAGQSLFAIVNDSSLYVTANFKETQLEKLETGLKAQIVVDAYPDVKIEGEVYSFAPITGAKGSLLPPDNATGNFVKVVQRVPVKIKINPKEQSFLAKLRPGMSVKVSVMLKH